MNRSFSFFLILIILIGLPISAWYFLNKGTQMRKAAMADLQQTIQLGSFQLPVKNDSMIGPQTLLGNRWLIALVPADTGRMEYAIELLGLFKQTEKDFIPNWLTIVATKPGEDRYTLVKDFQWPEKSNWAISFLAENHLYPFSNEAFRVTTEFQNMPLIFFVDENNYIRQFYRMNNKEDMMRLVRQYPVFLSLKIKNDGI